MTGGSACLGAIRHHSLTRVGVVSLLGVHLLCKQRVGGSTPLSSTSLRCSFGWRAKRKRRLSAEASAKVDNVLRRFDLL
jgi:hypothetical protein